MLLIFSLALCIFSCCLCIISPARSISSTYRGVRTWQRHGFIGLYRGTDIHPPFVTSTTRLRAASENTVESGVNLSSLPNFELDGRFLKEAITKYLDKEWIQLDVHRKLGLEVESIYVRARNLGTTDLGDIIMDVGTSLEMMDMKDAFVGAWDVANKFSDLMMVRLDRELCACSGDMSDFRELSNEFRDGKSVSSKSIASLSVSEMLREVREVSSSSFTRYQILRDFLDGEIPWQDMEIPFALCLGFREVPNEVREQDRKEPSTKEDVFRQTGLRASSFARDERGYPTTNPPACWVTNSILSLPQLGDVSDESIQGGLERELPEEDIESTDVALDAFVGSELLKIMMKEAQEGNNELHRRITVVRWMYCKGWLNTGFLDDGLDVESLTEASEEVL